MTGPHLIIDESEPAAEDARVPVDDARKRLQDRLEELIKQALAWHEQPADVRAEASHSAIKATTGIGKSEQLRQVIVTGFILDAKRRGLPHRVLILLPTHKLANEACGKMPNGVTTMIWQGRDGTKLGTDEPMCRNLNAVKAALAVGAEVEETACRKRHRGREPILCPLFNGCLYQQQKPMAREADVVFAAHEILFRLPTAFGKGFGLVIIDEAFWQDGIRTKARLVIAGLADELQAFPVRGHRGDKLANDTAHLRELIERVQCALKDMPDGYVQRAPLIAAGLEPATQYESSSCARAGKMEWARKVETGLRPGASPEELQAAVKHFGFIGQLRRRHHMWRALGELIDGSDGATGRLLIETTTTAEGPQRRLRLLRRKDIAKTIGALPIIVADGTLQLELVRQYLPNIELACDLEVAARHMRVTQVIGLPVGKASLQPLETGKRSDDEEARVARKRQRLVNVARRVVRDRSGLVVTYKDVEDDFRSLDGVETAHFGAIEGIDRWKDVDVAMIIGRPLPSPKNIERMAAALTGKPVTAGGMIQQDRRIRPGRSLKCRVYATPEAEMIRAAVAETAIEQAVGRVRGVNRTAANPVEVYVVLNDTVVPGLPVDEVVEFADLEPGAIDHMTARGLVPQLPADAAKLYPELFTSREAAKKVYRRAGLSIGPRGKTGTSPYRKILLRRCPRLPCVALHYQPSGRRRRPRLALVDPARVPDARAVLEAVLGPLTRFECLLEPESAFVAEPESRAAE